MSTVSPIAAVRVAGIRPAMPSVGSDPYEDGLDVELVTEPMAQAQPVELVAAPGSSAESGHDPARRAFAANAVSTVGPTSVVGPPAGRGPGGVQGNAAVGTGFDACPATSLGDPPRGDFATPFARAMQSYAQR